MPVAVSVAVPAAVGANCTATVHCWPGPRLVAVQVSLVMVNAPEPDSVTVSALLADPPLLVSVNVCETAFPTATRRTAT